MGLKTKVIAEEILNDIPYNHSAAHKKLAKDYLISEQQVKTLKDEIKKLREMCNGCRF